jgi:D-tyrosyl-tRNA(Tyr) deacylase
VIALVQRVAEARVAIGDRSVGRIGRGALLLLCAEPDDSESVVDRLIAKVLGLRIFADGDGKMNLDLAAVGGGLLIVSQFTLAADTSRGNRPGFSGAAGAELGRRLYERALATARRRRQRRVRRRHAGQPRQRWAGDDSDHAARVSLPATWLDTPRVGNRLALNRRTGRPP